MPHKAEAWLLKRVINDSDDSILERGYITFSDITDSEALVEPLYGCWEANMTHAIERTPLDVCSFRGEASVVLGNSGTVRVIDVGRSVKNVQAGDICLFFGAGRYDKYGFMELAHAYDAPGTIGVLSKRTKVDSVNLFRIPGRSRYTFAQWAAFSLRYLTAWSNWAVAIGALRLQLTELDLPTPYVWAWGGGTSLAELDLARRWGSATTMLVGTESRIAEATSYNVDAFDRRAFSELHFDNERFKTDRVYRAEYKASRKAFAALVEERTRGEGVSIFIDYIGAPVFQATLRALARQGVLATAGWKCGMETAITRARECIGRHIHVHTHYARHSEVPAAMWYAEHHGWMPRIDVVYAWDKIADLAQAYSTGKINSYFPMYSVNAV